MPQANSIKAQTGTCIAEASSEGAEYNGGIIMPFDEESELYTLEPTGIDDIHSSILCERCSYTEIRGQKVFKISNSCGGHSGFCVTLSKPLKADILKSLNITYITSANVSNGQMRLLRHDATNTGFLQNDCPSLANATREWNTVNLRITSFEALADEDGYVHKFILFYRCKEKADMYLQNMSFELDMNALCKVDLSGENCMYEQGATQSVAGKIQKQLTSIGIAADIQVNCVQYTANSSAQAGAIKYNVLLKFSEGNTYEANNKTAVVPPVVNIWLSDEEGPYSSSQTYSENWQKGFNNGGILTLKNHTVSCAEGIKTVEYAVLPEDADYTDENITWFAPQKLTLKDGKIEELYINSFMDYGDTLQNGQQYQLAVRAITNNSNYILHIAHNFKYTPVLAEACDALTAALQSVKNAALYCGSADNKESYVAQQLASVVNNKNIKIEVKHTAEGISAARFVISLSYTGDSSGLFAAYTGAAFTIDGYTVWHSEDDAKKAIHPYLPYDGEKDLILASEPVVKLAEGSFEEILKPDFGYSPLEVCTPPPVRFAWTDSSSHDGKTYTLMISESEQFTDADVYTVAGTEIDVYNLKTGTIYFWKVTSDGEESAVFTFETKGNLPRFLNVEGVKNIRDIGGWITTENKRVKQGLLYRAAELDPVTENGILTMTEQLNIKTDVDLRSDYGASPLGENVNYSAVTMVQYGAIFEESNFTFTEQVFDLLSNPDNYPMCYHCTLGRDRTGTVTVLLLGMLGVDEETIIKEYLLTLYSETGFFSESEFASLKSHVTSLIDGFDAYGDDNTTLKAKIEAYLLAAGVEQEQIDSIRDMLLEDIPVSENENTDIKQHKISKAIIVVIVLAMLTIIAVSIAACIIIYRRKK